MTKLNIYFDQNYFLSSRKFFHKTFFKSAFFNPYFNYKFKKGSPVNNNLIFSGPQKLINNLIKVGKLSDDITLNSHSDSKNYYFCNFDQNNFQTIFDLSSDSDVKILIGPLYDQEYLNKLSDLILERENIKIVVASNIAEKDVRKITNKNIKEKIVILPIGIFDEEKLYEFERQRSNNVNKYDCLIYFKNRKEDELDFVRKKLNNYKFKIFSYGDYKNNSLISTSLISRFGIVIGSTESQGIAINELLGTNLPLFVLDKKENNYEGIKLLGTSVPYWNNLCGKIIEDLESFDSAFDLFLNNIDLNKYQPNKLIFEKLSFQKMLSNLYFQFDNF